MSGSGVDWSRLSALYDQGAALAPPAREAWLNALPDADAALAPRLRRMLLPQEGVTEVQLAQLRNAVAAALPAPVGLQAGERLGAWELQAPLGEGGMGQVWRARRADGLYEAEAAIKLLRADLGGNELRQRFARERRLLGRLQHPGIAQLLDAGIDPTHGAYLVIEHVPGQTLAHQVRRQALNLAARVRLLIEVAQAVQAAHAQLIVHRDLKPANVMVTPEGHPKLLDFGIATLLEPDSTGPALTQITRLGGGRLTPAYAAPEQIAGEPVSTAVDVYALGVILFELATGFPPQGAQQLTRTQLEHAVLHQAPARFAELLRLPEPDGGPGRPPDAGLALGDLEAVCAKALRKAPSERYAGVGALIADLERFLSARPVSVRREDWQHRTRLWLRRNRALAASSLLVLMTLSGALGVSLWQRQLARQAAREAEQVSRFLTELIGAASPDRHGGKPPTVVELLDRKRAELTQRFNDDPPVKDRVFAALFDSYYTLQAFGVAMPLGEERLRHARQHFGEEDPRTEEAAYRLASGYQAVAGAQPIIDLLEPLLARRVQRHGPLSEEAFELRVPLMTAYGRVGRLTEAARELQLARQQNDRLHGADAFAHARFAINEGTLLVYMGRLREAEALLERGRPLWAQVPVDQRRNALVMERNLAFVRWRLARDGVDEALARSEALIARWDALARKGNHGSTLMRQQLAPYLQLLGEPQRALEQLQLAQAETLAAGLDDPVTGPLREIALREGEVLAAGRADADAVARAEAALARLDAAPLIADVRRAEGLLQLGRVALAPGAGAAGQRLGLALRERLAPLAAQLPQARQLQTRMAVFHARLDGDAAARLAAARQRVAYFEGLPEPQALPDWSARLQLACALRAAGAPAAELAAALAAADRVRPADLDRHLGRPHALDALRERLAAPDFTPDPRCAWAF